MGAAADLDPIELGLNKRRVQQESEKIGVQVPMVGADEPDAYEKTELDICIDQHRFPERPDAADQNDRLDRRYRQ